MSLSLDLNLVLISTISTMLFLIPHIVVIAIGHSKDCDQPLFLWVVALTVVVGLMNIPSIWIEHYYGHLFEFITINTAIDRIKLRRRIAAVDIRDLLLIFFSLITKLSALFIAVWFILGNIWLWRSNTCKVTNKPIYWITFADIVLTYFVIGLPSIVLAVALMYTVILRRDSIMEMRNMLDAASLSPVTVGLSERYYIQ
jgi:hypothetical protein